MTDEGTAARAGARAQDGVMSLGQHLDELRRRLIRCIIAVVVASIVSWELRDQVMAVVERPHVLAMTAVGQDVTLKYFGYMENVLVQIKVTLIAALIVTAPYLIYQIWAFLAPGLFPNERRKVAKIFLACTVCFVAGVSFGYFVFIPTAFQYLLMLAGPSMQPWFQLSTYVSLFFMMTLAMGIAFQTPVVVYCLIRWKIVSVETLQRHRKAMILIAFIAAGIITPTVDPVNQTITAVPLIVLYDLGALAAAPSRSTLWNFCQFTGIIFVLMAGVLSYVCLWPVAHATPVKGQAQVASRDVGANQTVPVRRGALVTAGEGDVVKVSFESASFFGMLTYGGPNSPSLYISGPGSLLVHGSDKVTLLKGDSMISSPNKDADLLVMAGPAAVTVADARAEIAVPDADTVTVSAFAGSVKAQVAGAEREVRAGRRQTFYQGGEPADLTDAKKRWQDLVGGAPGPAPAP